MVSFGRGCRARNEALENDVDGPVEEWMDPLRDLGSEIMGEPQMGIGVV